MFKKSCKTNTKIEGFLIVEHAYLVNFKSLVVQIEKALKNDRLRVSKVS